MSPRIPTGVPLEIPSLIFERHSSTNSSTNYFGRSPRSFSGNCSQKSSESFFRIFSIRYSKNHSVNKSRHTSGNSSTNSSWSSCRNSSGSSPCNSFGISSRKLFDSFSKYSSRSLLGILRIIHLLFLQKPLYFFMSFFGSSPKNSFQSLFRIFHKSPDFFFFFLELFHLFIHLCFSSWNSWKLGIPSDEETPPEWFLSPS